MTTQPELTPDQMAEIQQQMAAEQVFAQPVMLPLRYEVGSVQAPDGSPLVVLALQTPAGSQRVVLARDDAINLASAIKKQANVGPQLVAAPPGFVVPR